jgi:hypothetical protein
MENHPRLQFRLKSKQLGHKRPNPSRETVPLNFLTLLTKRGKVALVLLKLRVLFIRFFLLVTN